MDIVSKPDGWLIEASVLWNGRGCVARFRPRPCAIFGRCSKERAHAAALARRGWCGVGAGTLEGEAGYG
ncbi:MAG: hypothetical protein MZV63_28795 [Marinilabiliales bacterium]|nr:hypothetical protein [Marinilabiliales bacterium]